MINADDFGLTTGVSDAIGLLLDAGLVSSTTVMVCERDFEAGVKRWRRVLHGKSGVHLQLTGMKPLLPRSRVPSLYDDGERDSFRSVKDVDRCEASEVYEEWRAQVEKALSAGLRVTHLDTHHAVHLIPRFSGVFLEIASKYSLPVRGDSGEFLEKMLSYDVKGTVQIIRDWTASGEGAEGLARRLRGLKPPEPIEIITHPGYVDAELQRVSSLDKGRAIDFAALWQLRTFDWHAIGLKVGTHTDL